MPELPDVQVFKELIDATSLHRRIDDLMLRDDLVKGTDPQTIREHLRGSELSDTLRYGKHLFVHIDQDGWLRLHFGMTGDLVAYSKGDQPEYTQLRIDFDDGSHLVYRSKRKLGAISWVSDVDEFIENHELGPDALAGLGNVYVDEKAPAPATGTG